MYINISIKCWKRIEDGNKIGSKTRAFKNVSLFSSSSFIKKKILMNVRERNGEEMAGIFDSFLP